MVAIPPAPWDVATLIYKSYESKAGGHRNHLGASLIGRECERELWYTFRWYKKPEFSGRTLRLFETGNMEEFRLVRELAEIGIEVSDSQYRVSACGGHFGGSIDGAAIGVPEAPKTWHILEFKTHGEKSYRELENKGVLLAKPEHEAQMQIYMGLTQLERALYIGVCKNTDEIYTERIKYDERRFNELMQKAERIIFSPVVPAKLSANPAFYKCKFCNFNAICHYGAAHESNERNDGTHEPVRDGIRGEWRRVES